MACSTDSGERVSIDHAERALYALASELRCVPLSDETRRLHLRALELKRAVSRWREAPPDPSAGRLVIEEIDALTRTASAVPTRMDRSRAAALAFRRGRGRPPAALSA